MKKSYLVIALLAFVAMMTISCGNNESKIYPVKIGDYWGYVTNTGKYLVNPSFETAGFFHCGLARIVKDGKVGYINTKGKIVITPKYEDGTDFTEGRAFVVMEGESPVCINTSGKIQYTCPDWADRVSVYKDGIATVATFNNEIAYMDKTGKEFFSRANNGYSFSEGLAWRQDTTSTGYIDTKGRLIFELPQGKMSAFYTNDHSNSSFRDGMAAVKGENNKYGYIDKNGNLLIDFEFEEANHFSEGVALVKIGGKYGFIDKKGEFVINPQFISARSFQGGLAAIKLGSSWGYVNHSGTIAISPTYFDACDFIGGYALVVQDNKVGIIDSKGKMVVVPQFDNGWLTVTGGAAKTSVFSRKFIGNEFVPNFLKRHNNGVWDGISASTSLGQIRSMYQYAEPEGEDMLVCKTTFQPVDDIALTEMSFRFDGKTHKLVDYYDHFFVFYVRYLGKRPVYNNSVKVTKVGYTFTLQRSIKQQTFSAAKVLADGLAKEFGAEISDQNDGVQFDGFTIIRDDKVMGTISYDKEKGLIKVMIGLE